MEIAVNSEIVRKTVNTIGDLLRENLKINLTSEDSLNIEKDLNRIRYEQSDETEIFSQLEKWRSKIRFHDRSYLFKNVSDLTKEYFTIIASHEQFFEERNIELDTEPYYRQTISNKIEGKWDYERLDYNSKIYVWKMSGRESIKPCHVCNGTKK